MLSYTISTSIKLIISPQKLRLKTSSSLLIVLLYGVTQIYIIKITRILFRRWTYKN